MAKKDVYNRNNIVLLMVVYMHHKRVTDWLAFFQTCWKESGENYTSHICNWSKCGLEWIRCRRIDWPFVSFPLLLWAVEMIWDIQKPKTELSKKICPWTCMRQNLSSVSPDPHNCPDHEFWLNRDYRWELNVSTYRLLLKAKRLFVLQGNSSLSRFQIQKTLFIPTGKL